MATNNEKKRWYPRNNREFRLVEQARLAEAKKLQERLKEIFDIKRARNDLMFPLAGQEKRDEILAVLSEKIFRKRGV